jgi:sugar-specific transcriptional regulator TrmB
MKEILSEIKKIGLSDKAAKVYLAALELGEATVQELARKADVKRTTIYYLLDELISSEALLITKRNKKNYYIPVPPRQLLKFARRRLMEFDDSLEEIEKYSHAVFKRPRTYFLHGPSGFKQAWNLILNPKTKEYRIITDAESFLGFVKEQYIAEEIIAFKKNLGIKSKQIIVDTSYARKIVGRDANENRQSKFLPAGISIPFTEVIGENIVVFISPRFYSTILVIENDDFVETRKKLFDVMWSKL